MADREQGRHGGDRGQMLTQQGLPTALIPRGSAKLNRPDNTTRTWAGLYMARPVHQAETVPPAFRLVHQAMGRDAAVSGAFFRWARKPLRSAASASAPPGVGRRAGRFQTLEDWRREAHQSRGQVRPPASQPPRCEQLRHGVATRRRRNTRIGVIDLAGRCGHQQQARPDQGP